MRDDAQCVSRYCPVAGNRRREDSLGPVGWHHGAVTRPGATRAVIIAGGSAPSPGELTTVLEPGTLVIAADSGLDTAIQLGISVDVAIGDFDSVSADALAAARRSGIEVREYPADKDATDLELALELCLTAGIAQVTLIGAGGGRLDHELANVQLFASHRWAPMSITVVDDRARMFVVHDERNLPVGPGALVTLLAMGGPARGVTTRGLAWPLSDATLAPGSTRGVSNVAVSPTPSVEVDSGVILAIVPWIDDETTTLPHNG